MSVSVKRWALAALLGVSIATVDAAAQTVECEGEAGRVKAVSSVPRQITTRFQVDVPNLQPLISTTIDIPGRRGSCLVAHLTGLATITDNYIVFQVLVDGVPMEGHLPGFAGVLTPVVLAAKYDNVTVPTQVAAYNLFTRVGPGVHTVEVLAAAGSNIDPNLIPVAQTLVLTLEYR